MRLAYFDCYHGASESMLLGALVGAGADLARLQEILRAELHPSITLEATRHLERDVAATQVTVRAKDDALAREMRDVAGLIANSGLDRTVQERTLRVFHRMALALGRMLETPPEKVVLRANGSVAAIATVAAFVMALDQLEIRQLQCSPLPLGAGVTRTSEGPMPVPSPAVIELMVGLPVYDNGEEGEQLTVLAAALLSTLVKDFGRLPTMRLASQGWGIAPGVPARMCRLLTSAEAESAETREPIGVIETNIDDANPQFYEYVVERLFAAGAVDVFLTPIVMKRGRPGIKLTALVKPELQQAVTDVIFAETPSIGIRTYQAERRLLDREILSVKTDFGPIRVKVARQMGAVTNLMPEYKDCVSAARKLGVPLKVVWQTTLALAMQQAAG